MSVFYDPKKRQPKPWIIVAFIIIPILLVILGYFIGRSIVENSPQPQAEKKIDIFE